MARQGKLSGSPFHVENMFYKYAIENESKKYINEAEKELASPKVRADDLNYLRDKIASRQSRIQAFEKRLSLLSQELENAEKQAHK